MRTAIRSDRPTAHVRWSTPLVFHLLGLLMATGATSQSPPFFDRIGLEEGLPSNSILCLFEDRDGFLWIGTSNGLARHEGLRIRQFHHDRKDPHSLPGESINCIGQDEKGLIWVGTANGICHWEPATRMFHRHRFEAPRQERVAADRVTDIAFLPDGILWAITENGLYSLDRNTGVSAPVVPSPLQKSPSRTWFIHGNSMTYDPMRNGVWLCTTEGLLFHDLKSRQWFNQAYDPLGWGCFDTRAVSDVTIDPDGTVRWFDASRYALVEWRPGAAVVRTERVGTERMHFTARCMDKDEDGTLWLGTWTGRLFRRDPQHLEWEEIVVHGSWPGQMQASGVSHTLRDRHGARWFATPDGLFVMVPHRQHIRVTRAVSDAAISTFLPLGDSLLVLGTDGSGVFIHDLRSGRTLPAREDQPVADTTPDPIAGTISALALRDGTSCWVGTGRGVYILHLRDRRMVKAAPQGQSTPAITRGSIFSLMTDGRGRTWAGTWARGLYRWDADGRVTAFTDTAANEAHRLPINRVLALLEAANGDVWVGLNDGGGLLRLPGGEGPAEHWPPQAGADDFYAVVLSLCEDAQGRIWAGTHQGGLDRFDPGTGSMRIYTRSDGLPSDRIWGVMADAQDGIWASTTQGIAYLPPNGDRFVRLGNLRGVAQDRLSKCIVRSADRMLFAGQEFILDLSPEAFLPRLAPPEVHLVSVHARSGQVPWQGRDLAITLPHDQPFLSLELAIADASPHHEVHLLYRIMPFDTVWKEVAITGRLDVTAPGPGDHRLELRAARGEVGWVDLPNDLRFTVLPPFYATWWFRSLLLAAVSMIAYVLFRLYLIRRLATERARFEREQAVFAERMRIANDMHDDLGAGLSALKLRSEMALRTEVGDAQRDRLSSIAGMAGELIGSMRQIIWAMNEDQKKIEDLVVYATNYARQYGAQHGLVVHIHTPGPWPDRELSAETRRNAFLILKEAMHNVVKHAHARAVSIGMHWNDGLHMHVEDDGQGLPTQADAGPGNGLRSMRKRAATSGGTFQVTTEKGTRVSVWLPC
ncbi:MAG: hypothetical protein JNM31_11150 [Flavobacteriales bacterium]|nr:hypothetical protein [Flavobacteriales bacterium]